ncbi:MAG: SDR family NAD(P)-dependent oxidoreductase, partial [Methylobacteriaceae bacterium]|nr:SDR family NAD(P)-dependent oxidoreductase [Methylobacteriaceae bacterium]
MPGPASVRPLALVTGASAGIGLAFAEHLARQGHDLIVVARRRHRLEELATRLHAETGVNVEVLCADLTDAEDLTKVKERVAGDARLLLLVNNAGFGGYRPFISIDPTTIDGLINIHVR